jgi:hypothetical protein
MVRLVRPRRYSGGDRRKISADASRVGTPEFVEKYLTPFWTMDLVPGRSEWWPKLSWVELELF